MRPDDRDRLVATNHHVFLAIEHEDRSFECRIDSVALQFLARSPEPPPSPMLLDLARKHFAAIGQGWNRLLAAQRFEPDGSIQLRVADLQADGGGAPTPAAAD